MKQTEEYVFACLYAYFCNVEISFDAILTTGNLHIIKLLAYHI